MLVLLVMHILARAVPCAVQCGARCREGNVLLDDLELLHQDGDELLDDVGAVARILELDNDGLDDLVVDAAQIDFGGRGHVGGVLHLN